MSSARGRRSAGILAYRRHGRAEDRAANARADDAGTDDAGADDAGADDAGADDPLALEVFLVHPGGPFWARRDAGAWSIPKGEYADAEPALQAALREFHEETGQQVQGPFIELQPLRQPGGKLVIAFAVEAPSLDPAKLRSNVFRLEWPPRSGRWREFPEVDRAAWFTLREAHTRLLAAQCALLRELAARLGSGSSDP